MKLIRTIIGSIAIALGLTSVAVWATELGTAEKGSPSPATKGDTIKGKKGGSGHREGPGQPVCAGE